LSAFYSIAENARRAGDDIPETGVVAHGADTPEGAVQAIFDAVGNLDIEALIAALNPNEAEALQRYAPMFIDDAQKSLDDANAKIAFSDTKYSVSGTGDRRTVTVDGFTMSAGADGNEVKVVDEGGCVVMTIGYTTTNTCKGGSSADGALTALGVNENDDVKALIKTVQDAFADVGPTGITVQKVNGQWFVSPIGSIADLLLTELAALDKNELTDIIDGVKKVSQSVLSGDIFGGDTTAAGSDGGDTSAGSGSNSDTSGLDTCFAETDYPAYSACIGAGLDDGTIDPAFVAPYYRFVECGVGEQYWKGDVYSMSDEDFTAFALAAAPCFQKYISDGTISQFELPYELSRPDCLEGRNWYNVTDEAYTNRVFECAG
ncbi:MAG: hypothetical protein ABIZ69_01590, partial [Ilumatobacteraceae bacterium]